MRRLWLRILAAILLVMCGVLPNGQPASAAAAWDSPLSLSTENGFLGVRYGGGEWLAMGMSNTIAVSTDGGSNWNVYYPSGGVNEWTDAVYNGSGWVMVGTGGKIFTTKGSLAATKGNWTQRTSGATVNLWGIAFNGSRYVAVGDGGRVLYSDDQVNWTQGIMPGTGNLTGIVWSNDRYVAVSDSGNVYVSLDGAMWTKPYTATAPLYGVTYGNNMFVAVGAQVSAVSSDGGTWASGTATGNLTSVTYTNDQFVAAAEGGHIFSSADGKTWTDTGSASTTQDLLAVQYAAEQKRTITVGGDATTAVIRMQEENNSDLYKLTLSAGTLTPAFKPEIPAYTAAVTSDVTEITVTPTAQSSKATLQLKINGGSFAATASGVPSVKLPLDVGSNTIVVRVTAGDGVTFTDYTITVNRERPNYPPTAISLSNAVVAENEPAGKVIGTLGATDPDPGETFTYELKGTDASAFLIVGNMLNTKQPFDYETKPSYSIIIVVKDGKGAAFEQPFTITVTNVNEPPTVSNATKTGAEDQTTVFAVTDFGSYFVDADQGDSLKMLKILSLPANGKLKLNGVDVTVNQEVPAGQIATLQFVPNENWSGTTTFDWNASDGTFYASTQATMTLVLSEINDLPVVENSARSGMEDQAIAFGLNDFANYYKDIESALSKVQITGVPDNGKLLLTGTQVTLNQEIAASDLSKLVYLPNPNWYGEDRFGWKGSDGTDYSANSASVTLTISAVNDPPTVKNSSKTGVEDAELPLTAADFSGNYEDVEIDGLTKVQIVSLPAHAALKLDGVIVSANQEILANDLDKLRIVPDQDWNGTTGLDWKGHDGNSYSTVAATMSITITSLPDLPLVQNGAVDGQEDTDLVLGAGPFQQNYSDADGESLTKVMMVTLPENGGLTLNGVPVTAGMEIDTADLAQLKYTPAADFHGNDSIRWKGHDGTGFSTDAATMTLRIAAVNDLPSVIDSSMNGNEDEPIIFAESDFAKAFIDVDKDQLAKVQIVTLPVNGSLQLNGTDLLANAEIDAADLHKLAYVPDAEWYGADSFTWKGNDGNAYSANIATMSVTIVAVNDLPTVGNKTKAGAEDTVLQLEAADFTGVYADADNDLLRSVKIVRLPANGTLHLDGAAVKTGQEIPVTELAKLTFLPEQDWNGTDSVEWLGFDGTAYSATAATFSFDVNPVNDAPVAQNAMLTVTEGQQKQGRLDASDVEGDSLTFAVVIQPSKGTLTLDPNTGEFTYKPNRNERGKDTFTYKVNDGALDSTAATVTISITSLPPPITSNDANLSALRIAGGTLEPSFSAERTDYKLVLDQGVTEITVTPTTAHWAATVKVNGTPVMSGHASQPIKLERDQIRIDVTVTAMDGTQKTYTIVTGSQNVPIEKIVLDKTRVTMTEGDRPLVLTATVYPAEAQEVALQWTSSNPKIASVDQNGKVVPNGKGTATITVSTPDGKVKATSRITVKAGKPIALLADPLMLVMSPKETESLHIDAFFGYETKRDVTDEVVWKSEDSKIASVSAKGIVRAKKAGTTRIIASYKGMETAILVRVYEHKWVDERDITVSFTPNRTGSQFKLVVKGKLLEEDGLGVTVKVGKASYKAKMDKDGQSFSFQRTLKWKGELPQSIELRVSSDAKEEQVITLPLQLFDPEDVQLEKNKLNGTVFDRTLIANMEAVTEEGEHFYATWEENRFEIKLPATVTGKITLRATAFSGLQQEWEVKN